MARNLVSGNGPSAMVRVRHETAWSCSVRGRRYEADGDGRILVPVDAVDELSAHGFGLVEDQDPLSTGADTRARRD